MEKNENKHEESSLDLLPYIMVLMIFLFTDRMIGFFCMTLMYFFDDMRIDTTQIQYFVYILQNVLPIIVYYITIKKVFPVIKRDTQRIFNFLQGNMSIHTGININYDTEYKKKIDNAQTAMDIMRINLKEIAEYYSINKKQANITFVSSILACIIGLSLICFAILNGIINKDSETISIVTGISGIISEFIAVLFLSIYNSTLKQINRFYDSLNSKEKFLTTIELAKGLEENKESTIIKIIENEFKNKE
ncbi:hypothetical protein BXY41_106195 [Lacrimispora xylanisolvens]|uniref:Cyanobacterial TRADD-N associated 2 transmembrane domain-containing protein n=1 Tax=Lacrimispora xylanisolvens TaxID=384636 RepID=A0A2S6HSE4_9FIRM|nr:hypothetical protein [Hungatella xylanolytica]PPK80605.1 hypothetical protein BXY41_106195 [Hungatella xylanolytica]